MFLKTQPRSGTSFLFSTFSLIECAIRGSAMVASQYTTLLVESAAILPQLIASSRVHPERPPHWGLSVVIWIA